MALISCSAPLFSHRQKSDRQIVGLSCLAQEVLDNPASITIAGAFLQVRTLFCHYLYFLENMHGHGMECLILFMDS